jgi:hypothetical protein
VPLVLAGAALGALVVGGLALVHFINARREPALKAA